MSVREPDAPEMHRTGHHPSPKGIVVDRLWIVTTSLVAGLVCAAAAAVPEAQAAPAGPRPTFTVTLGVNTVSPQVGDTVKIRGAVEPAAPGAKIRLQAKFQGRKRWKTVDTVRLSSHGRYRFDARIRTQRSRAYRAVMVRAGFRWTSAASKVRVYGWVQLAPAGAGGTNGFTAGDAAIGGVTYPSSLVATGASETATWVRSFDYNCLTFRGFVGLADGSPAGSGGVITIGRQETAVTPGPAVPITLDLTGSYDLFITARSTGGGTPVVGSPEALCRVHLRPHRVAS